MSDAPQSHDAEDGPHEGPIKTPKQLILAVIFAFVVPIALIVLLVVFVGAGDRPAAGSDGLSAQAVAQRIQPVAQVEVRDASSASAVRTGEQVFQAVCTTCHTAGMLGAPKFGDAEAWAPRIKSGFEALLHSALNGKGNMTKQGGGDYSDYEIARAVVYMANKGGANFEEPKAPAGAASDAAAGGAAAAPVAAAAPAAATTPAAPATASADEAPALYTQVCQVCHAAGVAGAPKFGDKAAWAPRIGQGIDGLTASAIKGKNAMPPKGGSTASEAEIKAVVTYMVAHAK